MAVDRHIYNNVSGCTKTPLGFTAQECRCAVRAARASTTTLFIVGPETKDHSPGYNTEPQIDYAAGAVGARARSWPAHSMVVRIQLHCRLEVTPLALFLLLGLVVLLQHLSLPQTLVVLCGALLALAVLPR